MVRRIAIIPARSGSKRVPDKNICLFHGKPLMAWGIEAALQSGLFERVMVSTDSEQYAAIARRHGAWVPFLRESHSDDHATVLEVVRAEWTRLREELHMEFDHVASIQPTCPLITPKIIREAYADFCARRAERMLTCCRFALMNPWWAFEQQEGRARFVLSSPAQSRSQDRPPLYCPTGALCLARAPLAEKADTLYHEIDWKRAVDIDTYEDLEVADALYAMVTAPEKAVEE